MRDWTGIGSHTGGGFWLRWVVASAIGVVVAFVMFVAIFSVIGEPGDLLFPVLMAGVGGVVGAFQQRVLRRMLGDAERWAVATGVGLGVGIALALAMGEGTGLGGKVLEGMAHGAAIGATLGMLQWLVLRARVPGARWWVPVSIAGWSVGAATGDAIGYFAGGPFDLMSGIVVAAAATGIALVALLPSRPSARSQARAPRSEEATA